MDELLRASYLQAYQSSWTPLKLPLSDISTDSYVDHTSNKHDHRFTPYHLTHNNYNQCNSVEELVPNARWRRRLFWRSGSIPGTNAQDSGRLAHSGASTAAIPSVPPTLEAGTYMACLSTLAYLGVIYAPMAYAVGKGFISQRVGSAWWVALGRGEFLDQWWIEDTSWRICVRRFNFGRAGRARCPAWR